MVKRTIPTTSGAVRGREDEGVLEFLGIPYATAPVDDLRFRPPVARAPWRGVRDATEFGPMAPQAPAALGAYVPGDPLDQGEDCLVVNVWVPSGRRRRLPVMVFVHGGAFFNGASSSRLYRPQDLVRRGVVVVTFNYRLGALGFLAHPVLSDPRSSGFGNWGLHDQIAAFEWVRDNISAFGGDPQNVTAFGESAGAMAICDLMTVRQARGLFRRAIVQSGPAFAVPARAATSVAERLFSILGIDEPTREELCAVPIEDLVAAQKELNGEIDAGIGVPFPPVVDGGLLRVPPEDAIVRGASAGIDLLAGWNHDEFKLFSFAALSGREFSRSDLDAYVRRYLRGGGVDESFAAEIISLYEGVRQSRGDAMSDRDLLDAIITDWIFRIPITRLAEAHLARSPRTYLYEFDWPSPFAGGALGACHGIELPFVFGTVRDPIIGLFAGAGDEAITLTEDVQSAWVAFATHGDPSSQRVGAWPAYTTSRRQVMRLGLDRAVVDDPRAKEREAWERRLGKYGVGGPIEGAVRQSVRLLAPDMEERPGT
ncbi:MAG: carboxylesterase/lipase family protein [Acidimicrobiales bacterium]